MFSQLNSPPRLSSIYASLRPSREQRKTRGQVDRYSFLVRLLPPLLHAGLSRRTNIAIALIDRKLKFDTFRMAALCLRSVRYASILLRLFVSSADLHVVESRLDR
jgi:hypothetical protein